MALKTDGTVVAWGAGETNDPNDGNDDFGQSVVPAGLSNVVAIAAGAIHTLALKADGTVVAWGAGKTNDPDGGINFGQSIVPAGLSNVVAIAAGLFHSVALKADGTVVVWGGNVYGQTDVPPGLDNVVALAPGATARHVLVLRKQSTAPVAWLNSDNTFNGNITINGDTAVSGEMKASDLRLDDGNLWLRSGTDQRNGLGWYSAGTKDFGSSFPNNGPNGPVLFGQGGGALGTSTTTNGQKAALVWDASQQVGIGTTTPQARLDLGNDSGNAKLLLYDGSAGPIGFGVGNSQLRLFMNSTYGQFSFLDSSNGNQVVTINGNNYYTKLQVHGFVQLGSAGQLYAPAGEENLRIIRGRIAGNGTITTGQGFTVTKTGTGAY
ncbi:MAG TPA: hypothetical protein VFF11_09475, partial [Candidatus Binatia bacterium]|nr:hypothetical protein [Candidatus Binatia bacterium]